MAMGGVTLDIFFFLIYKEWQAGRRMEREKQWGKMEMCMIELTKGMQRGKWGNEDFLDSAPIK